jgi:hypothetical protein
VSNLHRCHQTYKMVAFDQQDFLRTHWKEFQFYAPIGSVYHFTHALVHAHCGTPHELVPLPWADLLPAEIDDAQKYVSPAQRRDVLVWLHQMPRAVLELRKLRKNKTIVQRTVIVNTLMDALVRCSGFVSHGEDISCVERKTIQKVAHMLLTPSVATMDSTSALLMAPEFAMPGFINPRVREESNPRPFGQTL